MPSKVARNRPLCSRTVVAMTEGGTYREGDRVVLADTHHAFNSELKKNLGREGVVRNEPSGHNDKYLVEFEGRTAKLRNSWWVAPRWLEPAEDGCAVGTDTYRGGDQ